MNVDWKSLLRTVAPALATALGGPLAGLAAQAISTAVLGTPDGTEEEIAAAIQTGGADTLIKLKAANTEFTLQLRKLDLDLERIANEDRASARQREISTNDVWTPRILAYMLTAGFFSVLAAVMMHGVPDSARDTVNLLLGSLGTVWLGAMAYYHGTTAGSRAKTEMLAKMEYPK